MIFLKYFSVYLHNIWNKRNNVLWCWKMNWMCSLEMCNHLILVIDNECFLHFVSVCDLWLWQVYLIQRNSSADYLHKGKECNSVHLPSSCKLFSCSVSLVFNVLIWIPCFPLLCRGGNIKRISRCPFFVLFRNKENWET